ncbi:cell division and transport-associated protein TolA [Allofrancisella inopinata]|uniref:Cell envelope integrity protein TolA n=1 Tax=Allofrancisella inopinata TaxID=1085647 RepID=A0AAE6YK98_9GAMM|nr:cell envelope integrity protein TolA [Allofrancisella inopinata]QIV96394.1 cell envelope integrity protein TolA [Allofrancisella inopinata]TDT73375.1 cell division and transport-associated protein TolA [Allofrancisella inopinata]
MANLNYRKILEYFRKQIDNNPFLIKAVIIHIVIVVMLYVLSYISLLKFDSTVRLQAQSVEASKQMQVIQATSITSGELNNQIQTYEQQQQKLRKIREAVDKAREQAIIKAKEEAKRKAREERLAKAKAEAEKLRLEQEKKAQIEAQKKIKEEAKRKAEAEKLRLEQEKKAKLEVQEKAKKAAKEEAKRKAREERLAKAKTQAEAAAKEKEEQTQAQLAVGSYVSEYKDRIGANWIKDPCRGIDNLPDAIIRNGQFIKLTGASGDYRCDRSMIDAIKNTTPPEVSNSRAKQIIQSENLKLRFSY